MALVLVTGGAGFIGSHVVDALLARGDQVRVLDNLSTGRESNLAHVSDRIELVRGDVRELDTVRAAAAGARYVLHQAAFVSVPASVGDPVACTATNVVGTLNVLLAARDEGVRRVVMAATSAAYGETDVSPQVETMLPAPVSPYAASKVAGELYCHLFGPAYGVEAVALRYFNVFGPRQDPNSQYAAVIPRFITRVAAGQPPVIYGTGRQSRDFIYVGDVAAANLLAMEAPGVAGRVFNIGSGVSVDVLTLLDVICRIMGRRVEPLFEAPRPGDVMATRAAVDAAKAALGFFAAVDLETGLRPTVRYFSEAS